MAPVGLSLDLQALGSTAAAAAAAAALPAGGTAAAAGGGAGGGSAQRSTELPPLPAGSAHHHSPHHHRSQQQQQPQRPQAVHAHASPSDAPSSLLGALLSSSGPTASDLCSWRSSSPRAGGLPQVHLQVLRPQLGPGLGLGGGGSSAHWRPPPHSAEEPTTAAAAAAAAGGGGGGVVGAGVAPGAALRFSIGSSRSPTQPPGAPLLPPPSFSTAGAAAAAGDGENSQCKPVFYAEKEWGGGGGGGASKGSSSSSHHQADLRQTTASLWLLAWPLSWMEVLAFAKELIITAYVGHLGAAQLSALVLAQTVYNVTGNAPMLGFVTAMETYGGQAYGAQRYKVVGLVLQRGLAISVTFCCVALLGWRWNETLLLAMGQDPTIAASAAQFTLALGPALLMDAADQCCRRYLSSQAVVQPLMLVTLVATLLTPLYLWLFVKRLGLGLLGAAAAWDAVQATSLALMVACCCRHTRSQPPHQCTWPGWSKEAFREWRGYFRMALPSCVMICLDWWTFEAIVMLSGLLPHPEQNMSMMGITFNLHALCFFSAHGLSGAASARVGHSLGAGRPQQAWLTVQVAVLLGTLTMAAASLALLAGRRQVGRLFSGEAGVVSLTAAAVPPLAVSLIGEGANTVLAGVMRGCGRQRVGAAINLVTYWGLGLPLAYVLAFWGKLGALGLWAGLACTASVQALLMSATVFRFNWVAEAARAKALAASGEQQLLQHHHGPAAAHHDGEQQQHGGGGCCGAAPPLSSSGHGEHEAWGSSGAPPRSSSSMREPLLGGASSVSSSISSHSHSHLLGAAAGAAGSSGGGSSVSSISSISVVNGGGVLGGGKQHLHHRQAGGNGGGAEGS